MPPSTIPGPVHVQPPLGLPLGLLKFFHFLYFRLNKVFVSFSTILPARRSASDVFSPFFDKLVCIFRNSVRRLIRGVVGIEGGDVPRQGNEQSDAEIDDDEGSSSCDESVQSSSRSDGNSAPVFEALEQGTFKDGLPLPIVDLDGVVGEDELGSTAIDPSRPILEEDMPIVDEPEILAQGEQMPEVSRKKALLIGIRKLQSTSEELHVLNGPHRDVEDMRGLLEGIYGYHPQDIVSLIDNDQLGDVQPTKKNILLQITKLVDGARDNDRFFFFFAGHSTQEDTEDLFEEEDGKNEFIVTSDNKTIMDNELRKSLIDPLPLKCSLVAVFDTCHSCSLLDLPHFRCNRIYVPWINKGNRRTDTIWASNQRRLELPLHSHTDGKANVASPTLRQRALTGQLIRQRNTAISSEFDHETAQGKHPFGSRPKLLHVHVQGGVGAQSEPELVPTSFLGERHYDSEDPVDSPVSIFCDGNCRKSPIWSQRRDDEPKPDVICLSSSKDSQATWEDPLGNSMTRCLATFLEENPKRSLKEVLSHVSYSIYNRYVDLHDQARGYKKEVKKINTKRLKVGKTPLVGQNVEMHNFQDPQISSYYPLDMNRCFEP